VAVEPDAEQAEVDAARGGDRGVVARGLGLRVGRRAVRQVRVLRLEVDAVEEDPAHGRAERSRIVAGEADIFVEVEGDGAAEADLARLAAPRELGVDRDPSSRRSRARARSAA
jgi:hypothetical protein